MSDKLRYLGEGWSCFALPTYRTQTRYVKKTTKSFQIRKLPNKEISILIFIQREIFVKRDNPTLGN